MGVARARGRGRDAWGGGGGLLTILKLSQHINTTAWHISIPGV